MNARELIDNILEAAGVNASDISFLLESVDEGGIADKLEELEVAVASQPSYPLANSVSNVTLIGDDESTLWIAVSQSEVNGSPYAPKACWDGE